MRTCVRGLQFSSRGGHELKKATRMYIAMWMFMKYMHTPHNARAFDHAVGRADEMPVRSRTGA